MTKNSSLTAPPLPNKKSMQQGRFGPGQAYACPVLEALCVHLKTEISKR
jgi:hypothetical protein